MTDQYAIIDAEKKRIEDRDHGTVEKRRRELRDSLSTPAGRRLWHFVLDLGGHLTDPFDRDSDGQTQINIGRAQVGREVMSEILEAAPESFFQMQRERASLDRQHQLEDEKALEELTEE